MRICVNGCCEIAPEAHGLEESLEAGHVSPSRVGCNEPWITRRFCQPVLLRGGTGWGPAGISEGLRWVSNVWQLESLGFYGGQSPYRVQYSLASIWRVTVVPAAFTERHQKFRWSYPTRSLALQVPKYKLSNQNNKYDS